MDSFILFSTNRSDYKTEGLWKPVLLDGYRIPDLITLHKFLKKELNLPSYSEPNLDSLDEILNDPDWVEIHEGICFEIRNYTQFLHLESVNRRQSFLGILNSFSNSLGYPSVYLEYNDAIQKELEQLKYPFQILT